MDESANYSEKKSKSDEFRDSKLTCNMAKKLVIQIYCFKVSRPKIYRPKMEMFLDNNSLHLACKNGDLKLVEHLIQQDVKLCFGKNWFGMTPLDVAVQNGKIDVINIFLKYCPESVKEVTATTMKTCLHMAVKYNKIDVLLQLLIWIVGERTDFLHLLNFNDIEEITTSQFSTSTKLLQTIRESLSSKLEDVNDLNQDVSKALDISFNEGGVPVTGDTFSSSENMDIGTDMNLQEPEAMITSDLTTQKMKNSDDYSDGGLYNRSSDKSTDEKRSDDYSHGGLSNKSSDISTVKSVVEPRSLSQLLLLAASITTMIAAAVDSRSLLLLLLATLLNFMMFLALGNLLHLGASQLKLRPQISISALLDSYMVSLKAIMPNEALGALFKSIPMLSNRSSRISSVKPIIGFKSGLLLIATLIATITFQVPFHLLGSTSEEGYEQDSTMSNSLVLFSSMAFISSVGFIINILHEFPQKPWPQILILALFGSYMFVLKAIMPSEARALFLYSIPILLFGICRKTLWHHKLKSS